MNLFQTIYWKVIPFKRSAIFAIRRKLKSPPAFYHFLRFKGPFETTLKSGQTFRLYNDGAMIENELFWNGIFNSWEQDTGWLWTALCPDCETVLDVGANSGIYSLVAKALSPDAQVYAFEPSRNMFQKLKRNNQLNAYDIVCEQIALSNQNGKQIFYDTPEANPTSASLSPKQLKESSAFHGKIMEYEVQTETLDTYIQREGISKIDLIKIDVEQHEPEVISGMTSTLNDLKPVIVIEVLNNAIAQQLNSRIALDQYLVFRLTSEGKAIQRKGFRVESTEIENEERNFLMVPKEKMDWLKTIVGSEALVCI